MEKEYDDKRANIGQCDFINNHILSAASTAIGSCIDKVKIGYLFMQLFAKNNFKNDLAIMNTIIKTVEDIGAWRVIFDNTTKKFVDVAQTISEGDFEDNLKLLANYFLQISRDSNIDLTNEEKTSLQNMGAFDLSKENLTQYLVSEIKTQSPERYANIQIGDEVEDMLNLAYQLLGPQFHKINMSFAMCCTLKNIQGSEAPQYETAAIAYVQQQRNHNI